MRKLSQVIMLGAILALSACGLPTTPNVPEPPVCATQSLACFEFNGDLSVGGSVLAVRGWSEDLPTPGYRNRWHYILSAPAASLLSRYPSPVRGWNGGAAVVWPSGRGGMYMETLTQPGGTAYWRLEMHPTDAGIAAQFAAVAGAQEYLDQTFQVRELNDGGAEILITEPAVPAGR